jgi:hypothetical protein
VPVAVTGVHSIVGAFTVAGSTQAVCFGAHQRGDEGSEHRAEQVGARRGELIGQKLFGVDEVVIGIACSLFRSSW